MRRYLLKAISSIRWTDQGVEHIARHGIRPKEVEEVCFNENETPLVRSGRDDLHYIFGKSCPGRYLFVVVRFLRRGEVRVVTARDMNAWEKNYFAKRGK